MVLSPTLSWATHVQHVVNRGSRLFAQCVSWCPAERLPLYMCGVTSGSPPSVPRRWFESEVRHFLDDGLHNRAAVGIASLSVVHFPPSAFSVGGGPDPTACGRGSSPDHARAWDSPDGAMIHVQKVARPDICSACRLPFLSRSCWRSGALLVRMPMVRGSANGVVPWMWHSSPGSFRVVPALVDFRHNFAPQFPRDAARSCEICWCSVSAIL